MAFPLKLDGWVAGRGGQGFFEIVAFLFLFFVNGWIETLFLQIF